MCMIIEIRLIYEIVGLIKLNIYIYIYIYTDSQLAIDD